MKFSLLLASLAFVATAHAGRMGPHFGNHPGSTCNSIHFPEACPHHFHNGGEKIEPAPEMIDCKILKSEGEKLELTFSGDDKLLAQSATVGVGYDHTAPNTYEIMRDDTSDMPAKIFVVKKEAAPFRHTIVTVQYGRSEETLDCNDVIN